MRERQICHYASALWGNEEVIGNGVMSKYLSPAEVCKRLEGLVSEKTLANWRCFGNKGPTFIKIGGRVFYIAVDVDKWVNRVLLKDKRKKPVNAI